ncbi:hypothetical protein [Exiguobacterium sp. s122]|uniref:hypothetical protein n=1 Tax=Exiguobacterium sp. s122 TaxID=2751220 RepID=UPI003338CF58
MAHEFRHQYYHFSRGALALISIVSLLIERLFFPSILAFIAIGVIVGFFLGRQRSVQNRG